MSYLGNQPNSAAFLTDQFSGNGSTTAWTLSTAPAGTTSILVSVSGILQDPSTYSVVGTTLTLGGAAPAGTGNISVRYLGIPASGVVTTAYRTVTEFTATAGQTTFTPPSYSVGFIAVYLNGARLGAADFTASNGTTIVLATGASVDDLVVTESFYISSVANAIPNIPNVITQSHIAPLSHTMTVLTSSTGTYTVPTGVRALLVEMVGAGGGGECSDSAGGPAAGSVGGTTSFGTSLLTCVGGSGGAYNGFNAGGTTTVNSPASGIGIKGSAGASPGIGYNTSIAYVSGGMGGCSPFGGAGQNQWATNAGQPGATNSGSGGGGGGGSGAVAAIPGGGGGAGGYIKALISSPAASYSYVIGAGGAGASAGTNGFAGGNGGSGLIIITEYYI